MRIGFRGYYLVDISLQTRPSEVNAPDLIEFITKPEDDESFERVMNNNGVSFIKLSD